VFAPAIAATTLVPVAVMIVFAVTVLVVAGEGVVAGFWRRITCALIASSALFVLWAAWIVAEYPRPCFEVVQVPVTGTDAVELVSDPERPAPCPASYWNTEGAHLQPVMLGWLLVLAVLGFMWFKTRPHSVTQRALPVPR